MSEIKDESWSNLLLEDEGPTINDTMLLHVASCARMIVTWLAQAQPFCLPLSEVSFEIMFPSVMEALTVILFVLHIHLTSQYLVFLAYV